MENSTETRLLPMIALRGVVMFPGVTETIDIGRGASLAALDFATENRMDLFVSAQKDSGVAIPLKEDIYTVGTIVKVKQMLKLPNNLARVVVQGLATAKIKKYCSNTQFFQVETEELPYTKTDTIESEVLARKVMELTKQYLSISGRSVFDRLPELGDDVNVFLNRLAMQIIYREGQKQQLLEETDTEKRLLDFCSVLTHETELSKIDKKIAKKVKAQIDKIGRAHV